MTLNAQAREWLYRYEKVLARHLPLTGRQDIMKEFRSNFLDELEYKHGNREIGEELMKEHLQSLGSPRCKAGMYKSDDFLMNPGLAPFFKMVSSIVLLVLAIVLLAVNAVSLGLNGISFAAVFRVGGELFTALTSALGCLFIVFYLIGRYGKSEDWSDVSAEESWSVDLLPENEFPSKVKMGDHIAELVMTLIALVLFLFFRDLLGIHIFKNGGHRFIPVLGPAFWSIVPLMMVRWALAAGFNGFMIRTRRWTLPLRLGDLFLRAYSLGITILLLKIGFADLFLLENLLAEGWDGGVKIFRIVFHVLLGLGVFGEIVEIIQKVVALYREPSAEGSSF